MFKKKKSTTSIRRRPGGDVAGSAQPRASVFSYRASRSSVQDNLGRGQKKSNTSSAVKTRRGRSWFRHLMRVAAVCVLLLLLMIVLWLDKQPKVVLLDSEGKSWATYRDAAAYQTAAKKAFSESILNSNKITIDKNRIGASLKREFPELAGVSISVPILGQQPTVYLQPSAARLIITPRSGQPVVLDNFGKAIASGNVVGSLRDAGLPQVQDQGAVDVKVGDAALPSTTVAFITEVVRQFKAKGVEVESMTLPGAPNELQVRPKGAGYYIKFNTKGDARVEAGTYLALREYLESQKKTPAEYVDVRVQNRAYFK